MHISQLSTIFLSLATYAAAGPCKPESSKSHETISITSGTTLDISSTTALIPSSIETTYTTSDIEVSSTALLDSSSTEVASNTILPTTTEETTSALPKETTPAEVFTGGFATFYYQMGNSGECGWFNRDDELIVALSYQRYDASLCGRKLRMSTLGSAGVPVRTVDVTVVSYSPTSMNENSLDLSEGAFKAIGKLDDGMYEVIWQWI